MHILFRVFAELGSVIFKKGIPIVISIALLVQLSNWLRGEFIKEFAKGPKKLVPLTRQLTR